MTVSLLLLPRPYDDELLYSVIARFGDHLPGMSASCLYGLMGIGGEHLSFTLPHQFSKAAANGLNVKSSEEVIRRWTLSPFYKWNNLAASNSTISKRQCLGRMVGSAIRTPDRKLYCAKCAVEDRRIHGETFWRRCHQIPGVLFCTKHREPLRQTMARAFEPNWRKLDSADEYVRPNDEIAFDVADKSAEALLLSARLCSFLTGKRVRAPSYSEVTSYKSAILHLGYEYKSGVSNFAALEDDFIEYFGSRVLEHVGATLCKENPNNWIRAIARISSKRLHPTYHGLLQVFLESRQAKRTRHSFLAGPWRCPIQTDHGDDPFPIKKLKQRRENEFVVATATCSCGSTFTVRDPDKRNPRQLHVSQIRRLGPGPLAYLGELVGSGIGKEAAARKLGIPPASAKAALRRYRCSLP